APSMAKRCRDDQRAGVLQDLLDAVGRDACGVEGHREDVPTLVAAFDLEFDRELGVLQAGFDAPQRLLVTGAYLSGYFGPDSRARRMQRRLNARRRRCRLNARRWRCRLNARRWRRRLAASQCEEERPHRTLSLHERTNTSSIALDVV